MGTLIAGEALPIRGQIHAPSVFQFIVELVRRLLLPCYIFLTPHSACETELVGLTTVVDLCI